MNRRRHPSQGGPTPADIERAKRAARQTLEQDARLSSGLANVRPVRHLHVVYDYEAELDEVDT